MVKNGIQYGLFLFLFSCYTGIAQSHDLPQPMMVAETTNVPPPPGLPLPIDDYIPYLLICGVIYGALKIPKLKNSQD